MQCAHPFVINKVVVAVVVVAVIAAAVAVDMAAVAVGLILDTKRYVACLLRFVSFFCDLSFHAYIIVHLCIFFKK